MTNKHKKNSAGGTGGTGGPAAPSNPSAKKQSEDSQDYSSFKTVFFYCMLIVALPVATFLLLNAVVLDGFFEMSEVEVDVYSAVGTVVSLHIALGLYIYRAYCGAKALKLY